MAKFGGDWPSDLRDRTVKKV